MVVKSRMKDKGHPQFEVENVVVLDEVDTIQNRKKSKISLIDISYQRCMFAYCPVCKLDMAVRKITVRGLCPDSMFNTVYTLTIMGAGAPRYLGHYTSSIQFDRDQRLWLWLDMKEGESKATRT